MADMIAPIDKNKRALDSLVSYYMNDRDIIGRDNCISVYESAEKMLPVWRHFCVDGITPDMDYKTVTRMVAATSEVITCIMVFIDNDRAVT